MLVLGLTGNIGCGKSSVSTIFMENNIKVVDADIVARQIFDDKNLLNEVFSTFGESIKNQDGSLNRRALGNIVFNDDEKLILLNNLTHPKIKQKILSKVEEYKNQGEKIVVIDVALLIEDIDKRLKKLDDISDKDLEKSDAEFRRLVGDHIVLEKEGDHEFRKILRKLDKELNIERKSPEK